MNILSPSILASDLLNLGAEIKKVEASGSKYVHIDIMDGVFVPNISFGMPIVSSVRKCTNLSLDVHLMIVDPDRYIEDIINCGADILTFHLEALNQQRIIKACEFIHSKGKKVGISIKPNTPVDAILPYLSMIDMVLVMTVEPGFGGQKFMEATMEKVSKIREINPTIDIEVDGGINNETIAIAKNAGANVFVLGTGFFKSEKLITAREILGDE